MLGKPCASFQAFFHIFLLITGPCWGERVLWRGLSRRCEKIENCSKAHAAKRRYIQVRDRMFPKHQSHKRRDANQANHMDFLMLKEIQAVKDQPHDKYYQKDKT